jgi:hypothetical protein
MVIPVIADSGTGSLSGEASRPWVFCAMRQVLEPGVRGMGSRDINRRIGVA